MQEKTPLVLDIGTEAVKAGFLKNTAVQYYERFGVFSGRDFEKEVIKKAVLKALRGIRDKAALQANHVILGLPVDILKAELALQCFERENPRERICRKEEEQIYQELFRKSRETIGNLFLQKTGIAAQELDFLEENCLRSTIDGYRVHHLSGYKGKSVEMKILSVFALRNYLQKFQQLFGESGLEILKIVHPGRYLPRLLKNTDQAVFIDAGGEATQAFVLNDGILAEIFDFPMGGSDFSKALSQTFGLSEEKARIFKERYAGREMAEGVRARMHDIFLDVAEKWLSGLKAKLQTVDNFLPSDVFVFGGASQLPEVIEVLAGLTAGKSPQILKKPQLVNLTLLSYAKQK